MLNTFANIQFTTKLFISMVFITFTSILITSGNAVRMADNGLYSLGKGAIQDIHQTVYNSLLMYDQTVRIKLDGDLVLFQKELKSKGGLLLDSGRMREEKLVNQVTKDTLTKQIPQMQAGISYINGSFDIVDNIAATSGSSATIFQLVDDKLLRISTTVKNLDGQRAVGTYIPSDSPVFKAIMSGQTFRGKAFVVNDWYLTTYAPIHDIDGKIIGALYVGQVMINPPITDFILKSKFGSGYFYVYTEKGEILIHPTLPVKTDLFAKVPALKDFKDGLIDYDLDGKERISFVKFYEAWGVYVNVSVTKADIIGGLDTKMLQNSLLVGLAVIAGGVLVTLVLVRSINKPLKALAEKSVRVGEGDYTIAFSSTNKDAIGQLTNSLGAMITKSREMLEDIIKSAQTLATASSQLTSISEQMVANADSTTAIADDAARDASEVSDNMNSVSAAMEESTVNLDMIAAASEEMGATIKEIAENSARARVTTEEAVVSAGNSHKGVQELGEAARAIGTVTETITEISEQTNLLALNATIEAARAGDAGKGFAVVANEIKELAKQTAGATGKIKTAIEAIQRQTGATVKDIESIATVINDVNDIVSTIVTAVEEQAITTNEIVSNVAQASQGITEINQNVASSCQMTTRMSEGVEQVKERSIEVKDNSQQIRSSADDLAKMSEKLTGLISRFKI